MNLRPSRIACALALAALSSQAAAVLPGKCDPSDAAIGGAYDIDIYLTGASAPQSILGSIMTGIMNAGFTTVYSKAVGSTSAGADYRAYCGVLGAGAGALSGKKIRFLHRARGGSVWGVNPVARDTAIATLSFSNADCVAASGSRNFDCSEVGSDADPSNVSNRKPDFGVSDVEPAQFKDPYNVEFGQTELGAAEIAKFSPTTQFAVNQVIFGLGLTNNLTPVGTGPIANLTKAQVTALLVGSYTDWNQVNSSIASGSKVTVCRRVNGSGTQATFNGYFLNFPCSSGNIATSGNLVPRRMFQSAGWDDTTAGTESDPFLLDPTVGATYVENPSSSNVRDCLTRAQTNTDHTFRADDGNWVKVQFSKAGTHRAIGLLSLDSYKKSGYATAWTFQNLDGLTAVSDVGTANYAGLINVISGAYQLVSEQSMQYNKDKVFPSADYVAFINLFVDQSRKEGTLAAISDESTRIAVAALPGVAGNPTPPTPLNPAENQTSKWTKFGNSCKPVQMQF